MRRDLAAGGPRRELAERVAAYHGGLNAGVRQLGRHAQARRDQRGLQDRGPRELASAPRQEPGDVDAGRLRRGGEQRLRPRPHEHILRHPRRIDALAGEQQRRRHIDRPPSTVSAWPTT